jgi:hypothetical protein
MKLSHSLPDRSVSVTLLTLALGVAFAITSAVPGQAQSYFRKLSQDTFTNASSQHQSEVEPSAFANHGTVVTAFQVGRIFSGGGADIGFATTQNGGIAWTQGYLPGLTEWGPGGGPNSAASDPVVAYDAKHNVWMICTLPIGNYNTVAVSRSLDQGYHWQNPVYVIQNQDADKNWIVCDNTSTSPHYGNCYVEWDNPDVGDLLYMSTSSDGGLTWSAPQSTQGGDYGIGGVPQVLFNGNVVVPFADFNGGMSAFMSTNGGQSWTAAASIASAPSHYEAGNLRSAGLPSSAIDGAGTVYLSWPDCSFESGCNANDIVYSSTTDGTHWTSKVRIPIDAIGSGVDHFINGMGIDHRTSGSGTHMAMTYYYYPVSNCGNNCQLIAGLAMSADNGQTWRHFQLSYAMQLSWLPNTFSGYMVADYVATVIPDGGRVLPIYAWAFSPTNGLLNEAMYTNGYAGYPFSSLHGPLVRSADEHPIAGIQSDHPARMRGELDNIPPNRDPDSLSPNERY